MRQILAGGGQPLVNAPGDYSVAIGRGDTSGSTIVTGDHNRAGFV